MYRLASGQLLPESLLTVKVRHSEAYRDIKNGVIQKYRSEYYFRSGGGNSAAHPTFPTSSVRELIVNCMSYHSKKTAISCPKCGEKISLEDCFKDKAAENELKSATIITCTNQDCPWEGLGKYYVVRTSKSLQALLPVLWSAVIPCLFMPNFQRSMIIYTIGRVLIAKF